MQKSLTILLLTIVKFFALNSHAFPADTWDTAKSTFRTWNAASSRVDYAPSHELGISAVAFDRTSGDIFLACEKHPALLRFAAGGDPKLVTLAIEDQIDIEAIAIHKNVVYLADEDTLQLYAFSVPEHPKEDAKIASVTAREIMRISAGELGIDRRAVGSNPSDLRSLEGLTVIDQYLGAKRPRDGSTGPWFYLLDEQDQSGQRFFATVYIASQTGSRLRLAEKVSFVLSGRTERFTELFVHDGELFALASKFGPPNPGEYVIAKCDLRRGTRTTVLDFSKTARQATQKGHYSNYEGAAVDSAGKLFVASDNESQPRSSTSAPGLSRKGLTSLVTFPHALRK